ncbi:FkbM family methyltransferase [Candidatus Roizmanbacteria bacterium]|nr:MAG: FkbM family methyltransferase [Candidatus Roizmanbacteria bacterium]
MFLDKNDTLGLSLNGSYEEFETEIVQKEIKRGDVVLDIGANIGYYTLIFARLVGEKGMVFAFEPDPTNFALLKKNVEMNGYKNVVLVSKAVSDKSGTVRLYLCEENKGDHRIYNSGDERDILDVECIRLDDYFDKNQHLDFIKMDIQGAEGLALQGMQELLKRNDSVKIITEFWPIGLKRSGISTKTVLTFLRDLGFSLYELDENTKQLDPVNITALLKNYTAQDERYTSLFCVKGSS